MRYYGVVVSSSSSVSPATFFSAFAFLFLDDSFLFFFFHPNTVSSDFAFQTFFFAASQVNQDPTCPSGLITRPFKSKVVPPWAPTRLSRKSCFPDFWTGLFSFPRAFFPPIARGWSKDFVLRNVIFPSCFSSSPADNDFSYGRRCLVVYVSVGWPVSYFYP